MLVLGYAAGPGASSTGDDGLPALVGSPGVHLKSRVDLPPLRGKQQRHLAREVLTSQLRPDNLIHELSRDVVTPLVDERSRGRGPAGSS